MKKLIPALLVLSLLVGCSDPTGGSEKIVLRYDNGQKQVESSYENGKFGGTYTTWYENGQKKQEGSLKSGEQEGLWTRWDGNGQKTFEGSYKNGEREGPCTYWGEDGSINTSRSGIYKAGKKVAPLPDK